jgi:EGF-like domain
MVHQYIVTAALLLMLGTCSTTVAATAAMLQQTRSVGTAPSTRMSAPAAGVVGVAQVASVVRAHPCNFPVCRHGGMCVPNGVSFVCTCAQGWGGPYCQNAIAVVVPVLQRPPTEPRVASRLVPAADPYVCC